MTACLLVLVWICIESIWTETVTGNTTARGIDFCFLFSGGFALPPPAAEEETEEVDEQGKRGSDTGNNWGSILQAHASTAIRKCMVQAIETTEFVSGL